MKTTPPSLRQTASEWHSGQYSPLYAFSSTGTITPGLEAEIFDCLRDASPRDTERLQAILDFIAKPQQ
jgi:hypothetical protein